MQPFALRTIRNEDRDWIRRWMIFQWGAEIVIVHDEIFHPADLPGFVATDLETSEPIGLITYHLVEDSCEIITLDSLREGIGIGNALIEAVKEYAIKMNCRRLWLVTTNDNMNSLRFYQKRGFVMVKIDRGAVERGRKKKPEIPATGFYGIPIRDEIELELVLTQ
ncbi:MAG: GNAT family N-acetyltransferase [Chloroflexi bacterium HGW-Chloroflexi-10]|nr:MAG: GNAT family N-acetyltransferase [Chloroflexi bacterium HGW-Chloroflexi-10]